MLVIADAGEQTTADVVGIRPVTSPRPVRTRQRSYRRSLVVLTVLFAISRLAYLAAGVRFDMWPLGDDGFPYPFQLLDPNLLQHHLVTSVWHLNAQPPLYNVYVGILLHLPDAVRQPVAALTFLALGLAMVLCVYAALTELNVPRAVAFIVTVAVIADPAYVLYENWLAYAYPTAAFLSVAALCLIRFVRTDRWTWGAGFFSMIALVALVNGTYQTPWLAACLVIVLVALRHHWRSVVRVAAVPLLIFALWVVKDYAQVGTLTTSTWLGMNLAHTTVDAVSPQEIRGLIDRGTLTPIAAVDPFDPVSAYVPRFARLVHTGVAAYDQTGDSRLEPNFNNPVYVKVSSLYLHDDLALIRARPGQYLRSVARAGVLWTVPPDEYPFIQANRKAIDTWADAYDRVVLLRPAAVPVIAPDSPDVSYTLIAVYALAVLGAPVLAWRRRRTEKAQAALLAFLAVTTIFALVATSLIEFGENERFAMELGPLPLVAATAVVVAALRPVFGRLVDRRLP